MLTFVKMSTRKEDLKNGKSIYCVASCECGKLVVVKFGRLKYTKFCTSCANNIKRNATLKHGLSRSPIYKILEKMKSRCYNKNHKKYKHYGGRGITICQEWLKDAKSFIDWASSRGWKKGLEVDRIDVNGNYEPSNCRLITHAENCKNTTRSIVITYNGETGILKDLNSKYGVVQYTAARIRYKKGWTPEQIFTIPPRSINKKRL